jgi:hypothetical protein
MKIKRRRDRTMRVIVDSQKIGDLVYQLLINEGFRHDEAHNLSDEVENIIVKNDDD